jgi:hypothetical protein
MSELSYFGLGQSLPLNLHLMSELSYFVFQICHVKTPGIRTSY